MSGSWLPFKSYDIIEIIEISYFYVKRFSLFIGTHALCPIQCVNTVQTEGKLIPLTLRTHMNFVTFLYSLTLPFDLMSWIWQQNLVIHCLMSY